MKNETRTTNPEPSEQIGRSTYERAYRKNFASTLRFLMSAGVPSDEAEDIAQAGWLRGWERRKQLRDPNKVVSWINRISLNLFRNRLRRARPTSELNEIPTRPGVGTATIDLYSGLKACSREERRLLRSYYLWGYTSRELARRYQCSPEAVRVRALRAKRKVVDAVRSALPAFS